MFSPQTHGICNKDSSTVTHIKCSKTRRDSYLDLEAVLGVWIWDPVLFEPLDLGSGMEKKSRSRIRDEHTGSYF
jgi:hypothetical protein